MSSLFRPTVAYAEPTLAPDLLWDPIVSIEPVGYEHVYDIEVQDTHNFIGNGIFAHNTYVTAPAEAAGRAVAQATGVAKAGGEAEKKENILTKDEIRDKIANYDLAALVIDEKDNWPRWIEILTNDWGFGLSRVITAQNEQDAQENIAQFQDKTKIILVINATNNRVMIRGLHKDIQPLGLSLQSDNLSELIYQHLSQSQALKDV